MTNISLLFSYTFKQILFLSYAGNKYVLTILYISKHFLLLCPTQMTNIHLYYFYMFWTFTFPLSYENSKYIFAYLIDFKTFALPVITKISITFLPYSCVSRYLLSLCHTTLKYIFAILMFYTFALTLSYADNDFFSFHIFLNICSLP